MTKHTPGPWTYRNGAVIDSTGTRVLVTGVRMPLGNHPQDEEAEANGRLIAAAPEMLDALHQAQLQIEYLHEKSRITGTGNAVISRIEAVINKAELTTAKPIAPAAKEKH